jgi:Flp pilus assembly pilin Flp
MREAGRGVRRFIQDQSGATAIEYAILGMCIFLAILAVLPSVGVRLVAVFPAIIAALN